MSITPLEIVGVAFSIQCVVPAVARIRRARMVSVTGTDFSILMANTLPM
jgi:hypothetical protein